MLEGDLEAPIIPHRAGPAGCSRTACHLCGVKVSNVLGVLNLAAMVAGTDGVWGKPCA